MTTVVSAIATLESAERSKLAMEIAARVISMRAKFDRGLKEQEELKVAIEAATNVNIEDAEAVDGVLRDTRGFASENFLQHYGIRPR
jgi:hypothetical protein